MQAVLLILVILGLYTVVLSTVVSAPVQSSNALVVSALRDAGRRKIKSADFEGAVSYYSAALQLVEGLPDEKSSAMRRRCGLTLAECELRSGNYDACIARCSEIIDEANNDLMAVPNLDASSEKDLRDTASLAHFRRALAFRRTDRETFARIDLIDALRLNPSHAKAAVELKSLKGKKLSRAEMKNARHDLTEAAEQSQCSSPRRTQDIGGLLHAAKGAMVSSSAGNPLAGLLQGRSGLSSLSLDSLTSSEGMVQTLSSLTGVSAVKVRRMLQLMRWANKLFTSVRFTWNYATTHLEMIVIIAGLVWVSAAAVKLRS